MFLQQQQNVDKDNRTLVTGQEVNAVNAQFYG